MDISKFSVVLVEPKYGGNVGSVARVMKNFGFSDLVILNPPELSGEALAMAMHGRDVLEGARTVSEFSEITDEFDYIIGTSAKTGKDKNTLRTPIFPENLDTTLDFDGKIGILFGREDYGLLNEELKMCDATLYIPASKEYSTLNLSQAAVIVLYEIFRIYNRGNLRKLKKLREANKIEKDVLLRFFDSMVARLYPIDWEARLVKKTFRQMLGRSFMSGKEATTLTGLFRRATETVENAKD